MKFGSAACGRWLMLSGCFAFAFATLSAGSPKPSAIPGEYIIVLKDGVNAASVAQAHGLARRHTFAHALNGFAGHIPEARLNALKNDARVAFIEPDLEVFALAQTISTGVKRIGTLTASAAKIDGSDERVNVDVAILDTGIDLTHPDLFVYRAVSFTTNDTTGDDFHGHGTHVAGIVGALDNRTGVVGVAPGVRLWAVKVLTDAGSGNLSSVLQGVDYVTANAGEIEVANLSLGGLGYVESLRIAIRNSIAKGVVFVVAAGNSSYEVYGADRTLATSDDFFPACYPEVLTVSALADSDGQAGGTGPATNRGADDTLATFSNYSNNVVPDNPVDSPGAA
ncbi:MAG: S8 family serine peptidase, partial [Verrucomicrobia subdivision 3 bacterium]|nr:S8 family serine peptidase [Limisphaerales bacterium]